jgi:adenine specific DNA methylase Mod
MEDLTMKQRIAVTWSACGYINVEADSIEEAMNKVRENPDDYPLPYDGGEYVDGSFGLSTDDVEEMKMICQF